MEADKSLFGLIPLCPFHSVCPVFSSSISPLLLSSHPPFSLSFGGAGGGGFGESVQEASWSACLSSGLCFHQYILRLVCLSHRDSTRRQGWTEYNQASHFICIGHCIQHRACNSPDWSMLDLEPSNCDVQDRFLAVEDNPVQRVRFCKVCKVHVKGFDHHCPAFGNCIGQKNHVLFIILLVGFIVSEVSYIGCSSQFFTKSHVLDKNGRKTTLSSNLANSTMLFSLLQVLWQAVFLTWHIYCVCFNITTDEWVNWKKYPELQMVVQHQPGTRFINLYDKGILQNLKDFLKAAG